MKRISSRENPLVKRIRAAIRDHADEIVLEGPKPVADALEAGWKPLLLARSEDAPQVDDTDAAWVMLTSELFEGLAGTRTSQGVLALFERPSNPATAILARRDTVAVALDGVQDPGNVGTIVRLAAAFDAAGVLLLPGCADPFAPKAIRSSAGAILRVPVAQLTTAELLASGVPLVAADMNGAADDPPARDAVLIFGNEGSGVSDELMRRARIVSIPMSEGVESLNVASSAAILLSRSFAIR
ncbi:MAG TPA: RNA methyltransferase [Thermoanaerobaculia bacterium]